MSLIIKPPSWSFCTSNLTETGNNGTTITSGAANTKGTAVSCLAALAYSVEYLVVSFSESGGTGVNTSGLCDILIDPAGGTAWSGTPLIPNLLCGFCKTMTVSTQQTPPVVYYFPIFIPAGASIGAQWQCATTTRACTVAITAFGGNSNPGSWWAGQRVTAIGPDTATSMGIVHTPGSSSVFSTWENFGSTLSQAAYAFVFAAQGTGATATTTGLYTLEMGIASVRIGASMMKRTNTTEDAGVFCPGPLFYSAPSGTQMMVRGTATNVAQALDMAIYAIH